MHTKIVCTLTIVGIVLYTNKHVRRLDATLSLKKYALWAVEIVYSEETVVFLDFKCFPSKKKITDNIS